MDSRNSRRYDMLKRVCDFGEAHTDAFPAGSPGRKAFAAVATSLAELDRQSAAQVSKAAAVREGSQAKVAARTALRDALRAIATTAQAIALDTPGLDHKFRVPDTIAEQVLLSTGRAFAQDVRSCAAAFVAHGLPATFRKDLDAAIRGFESAIRENASGRGAHAAARAAYNTAMESAMTAVWRLDAIVANRLHGDPAAIAAWERARRVDRASRTRGGATEPESTAPTSSAPPAATPAAPAPVAGEPAA